MRTTKDMLIYRVSKISDPYFDIAKTERSGAARGFANRISTNRCHCDVRPQTVTWEKPWLPWQQLAGVILCHGNVISEVTVQWLTDRGHSCHRRKDNGTIAVSSWRQLVSAWQLPVELEQIIPSDTLQSRDDIGDGAGRGTGLISVTVSISFPESYSVSSKCTDYLYVYRPYIGKCAVSIEQVPNLTPSLCFRPSGVFYDHG